MFAEIIPAIRLPRKLSTFTYQIPTELAAKIKIGQIIETSFRGKKIQGVVKEIKKKINFPAKNLKAINKILNEKPLLTPQQFKLAEWLANYYFSSLGLIIKTIIPAVPKRKVSLESKPQVKWQNFQAKKIKTQLLKKKSLLQYNTLKYKNNYLYSLIQTTKNQILILVPELSDLAKTGRYLNREIRKKTVVFHGNLNKNQEFNNWQEVLSGRAKIIIGTRQAVFAPFKNLELIIIEQEEDSDFKQWDQNPRYDARTTAEKLAELTKAKILLTSPAPRIETSYQINQGKISLIKEKENKITTKIINLKDEIKGGNYSLISDQLEKELVKAKLNKKKAVLYLNRRGIASSVVCGDCGYIFNCPHCLIPLAFHQGGQLICHHCNFKQDLPANCPTCRGVNFKFPGRGTQLLEKELQTVWPGSKILRLDSDTNFRQITEHQIDSADIYLGTDLVFKKIDWSQIGLVGILSLDNMFYLPSFRANERLWQTLKNIALKTSQGQTDKIFLQTFNPDNQILKFFVNKQDDKFYQNEIANRRELNYPPSNQLIKLIFQSPNQKKAEYQANDLHQRLTKRIKTDKMENTVQLSEPQLVYTSRVRGRFRYLIIIKTKTEIKFLLKIIPENWLIDVDPEEL